MLLPELLILGLAVLVADSYDRRVNYWDAFAPGQLLERLNAFTDVDQSKVDEVAENSSFLTATNAQPKAGEYLDEDVDVDTDALNDDVDRLSAEASHGRYSGEDYEHNYEQFVKEYFDRAAAGDDINGSLELEEENQTAEPSNIRDYSCRRVKRKDGKLCEVCLQLKNNKISEICSYSHDDQPEQYKGYRNDPQKRKESHQKPNSVSPSSLCLRHQQENRVCYECKDSNDHKIERCYDD